MSTHLEAVYENGVFRPLQPVHLPEQQRVTVTIDEETEADRIPVPPRQRVVLEGELDREACAKQPTPMYFRIDQTLVGAERHERNDQRRDHGNPEHEHDQATVVRRSRTIRL